MRDLSHHKDQLRHYFDGLGFERWSAIYGEVPLSAVRRTIREGHQRMLAVAETWLRDVPPSDALDAGCGTGLLSLWLAQQGWQVRAVDLAPQMAEATKRNAQAAGLSAAISTEAADLETVSGSFDLVACFDVLIHYPAANFAQMAGHLASLSRKRLLITYAPHSPLLAALHRVGGLFPKGQRRTEIQMIPDQQVENALHKAGFRVQRRAPIRHRFYHVTLVEAVRHAEESSAS